RNLVPRSHGCCCPLRGPLDCAHTRPETCDMLHLTNPTLLRDRLYIDGEWVQADSGATLPVFDPATGETIVSIPNAGADETRRAIEAADRAFTNWRDVVAKERGAILKRWFRLIMDNQ